MFNGTPHLDLSTTPLHGDQDREKILKLIDSGKKCLIQVRLTPGLALVFLERNKNIRNLDKNRAKDYAYDMDNGGWVDGVAHLWFNAKGDLVNGQHTCSAAIKVSHDPVVLVETGCTRAQEEVIDCLSVRRPYQNMSVTRNIQAIANNLYRFRLGGPKARGLSVHKLKELLNSFGPAIHFAGSEACEPKAAIRDAAFGTAIATAHAGGVSETKLRVFLGELNDVDCGNKLILRFARFMGDRNYPPSSHKEYRFQLTLYTLDKWLQNDDGARMQGPNSINMAAVAHLWPLGTQG